MRTRRISADSLLSLVYERKVVTKTEMIARADCSTMSLWRVLRAHGYLTSFNFNARYYTLRDIPTFDRDGLWVHNRIAFSVHGSLTATVRALATNSATGLTCAQLQQQLAVNVAPTLRKLCAGGGLFRQKHGGVFVYLAAEGNRREVQLGERCRRPAAVPPERPPVDVIIALLVELIPRLDLTAGELSVRLSQRGIVVSAEQVQKVLRHYDLDRAKKGLSDC